MKDALISTYRLSPDYTVYEQGGGRVDLARAVKRPVHATGTVGFGELTPDSGPQSAQLTYTNAGPTPLTLNLTAELRDAAGHPAPAGAVRLSDGATVTVPAGGQAHIDVTLDAKSLPAGRYGGSLTATSGDGKAVAHTVLAAAKGAPRHKLTLTAVDRAGRPAWVTPLPLVLVGPHSRDDVVTALRLGETLTVTVPEGSYFLHGVISDRVENGSVESVVVDPGLTVDRDRHVVLDARKAVRVRIETSRPAVQEAVVSFYTHRAVGGRSISNGHMDFSADARRLYVTPTKEVTDGVFEFNSRWQLTAPQLTARALRAGRAIDLEGGLLDNSPTVDGRRSMRLLDAGTGRPEDYAALRARRGPGRRRGTRGRHGGPLRGAGRRGLGRRSVHRRPDRRGGRRRLDALEPPGRTPAPPRRPDPLRHWGAAARATALRDHRTGAARHPRQPLPVRRDAGFPPAGARAGGAPGDGRQHRYDHFALPPHGWRPVCHGAALRLAPLDELRDQSVPAPRGHPADPHRVRELRRHPLAPPCAPPPHLGRQQPPDRRHAPADADLPAR
ncbi:hypothetical protein [Streptomyces atratus]|uniref:hypothetical protein n=1 Tax=Streptomyces atratus TaxID=1893 RepID=UPI00224F2BAB|nr:hypothetical protein [Streptomyces atratus]MCX5338673.1 hypothetical protein [Streptomyces atratus]